jgi:hypothetical protein
MFSTLIIGVIIGVFAFNRDNFSEEALNLTRLTRRAEASGVVLHGIEQTQNLITMEADMSVVINLDNSWGELGMFSSSDEFTYYGTGIFTTDLAALSHEDIIFDEIEKTIHLIIGSPSLHEVVLRLEETEFETERGFFRWGQLSLSPQEHVSLQMQAEAMLRISMLESLMVEAYEYTRNSVTDLVRTFLFALDMQDYEINILWR